MIGADGGFDVSVDPSDNRLGTKGTRKRWLLSTDLLNTPDIEAIYQAARKSTVLRTGIVQISCTHG